MTTSYINDPIEGINNKIKVIKRIVFEYHCFYHLKSRILMIQKFNITKSKNPSSLATRIRFQLLILNRLTINE